MISRARHLRDDRLYECYVAAQTGDPLDPRAAEHLADCADCHTRYAALAEVMTGLRTDADAEIDALYSAEALHSQQSQIARKLEHLGHAARVISFPQHTVNGSALGHGSRITPRWLAAAAAAGLFVGVGVGSFLHVPSVASSRSPLAASAPVPAAPQTLPATQTPDTPAPAATPVSAPGAGPDDATDAFLAELEFALERPGASELRAFDELTPHAREVSFTTRAQ